MTILEKISKNMKHGMELQSRDYLRLLLQKRDLKFVKTIVELASFLGFCADHDGNYGN